jgi:hypothetical protein
LVINDNPLWTNVFIVFYMKECSIGIACIHVLDSSVNAMKIDIYIYQSYPGVCYHHRPYALRLVLLFSF